MAEKRNDDSIIPDFVKEAEVQLAGGEKASSKEEGSIKSGKGLAEPFQSKDGREFVRISIPNQDPADKSPWARFVLPAKAVHENRYGKGLWAKLPADRAKASGPSFPLIGQRPRRKRHLNPGNPPSKSWMLW